jgi:hypothetical protein
VGGRTDGPPSQGFSRVDDGFATIEVCLRFCLIGPVERGERLSKANESWDIDLHTGVSEGSLHAGFP